MDFSIIKQLLSFGDDPEPPKETAYARAAIGKDITMEELLDYYLKTVTKQLQQEVRDGNMECIIRYPRWVCKAHQEATIAFLQKTYRILYNDDDIIVVSWRIK